MQILPMQTVRTNFFRFSLFSLILALCCNTAIAAVSQDPTISWKTMHTPHFYIHYHDGEEALAKETAVIAERAHQRLSQFLDWTPSSPTELILTDRMDFTNGWATPLPRNTMNIIVSPPDDVGVLDDYSNWLELLITHEYTHILHMDKATGASGVFRKIFGRLFSPFLAAFPNAYQPSWVLEGLATYTETDTEKGIGRGQSNSFKALMRMEVETGVKPITQVNQPMVTWPAGTARYLYGVYFMNFIRDTYGEEKLREWIHNYSNNLLPFFINRNAGQTFGKSLGRLWPEFETYVQKQFRPQLEHIKSQGLVAGTQLSQTGYYTGAPRSLPNGDIFYVQDDFLSHQKLMRIKHNSTTPQVVAEVETDRYDVHPTAGIIMARLDLFNNASYFSDLHHIDIETGRQTRLTSEKRYIYATWNPQGDRIVAVHNHLSEKALHLLDANGNYLDTLWSGKDKVVVSQPDWSPDGKTIVASVWRPDSQWNLEAFSLAEKRWVKLTQTADIEAQPQFTHDGKSIIFCADYDGVYNVRKLDLLSGKTEQLSNVLGGAFAAVQHGEGRGIVYMGVSGKGYDIYKIDDSKAITPVAYQEPAKKHIKSALANTEPNSVYNPDTAAVSDYNGLTRLTPTSWFPILFYTPDNAGVGITTWGTDPLERHYYEFSHAYDFKQKYSEGYLDYIYDRWNPALKLSVLRTPKYFLNSNDEAIRTRISETLSAELIYPILKRNQQLSLHLGVLQDKEKDVWRDPFVPPQGETLSKLAGAAITYNSSKFYPRAVSPSEGMRWRLVAEDYDTFDSDHTGQVYTADIRAYFDLGHRTAMALRLAGASSTDAPKLFSLGGVNDGYTMASPANSVFASSRELFNRRSYALRGYKEGLTELSGTHMSLFEMEVRFPIYTMERGSMYSILIFPTGIHNIYGRAFYNVGDAWNDSIEAADYKQGTGFEVNTEIILGYMFLLDLRIGVAHGLDPDLGEDMAYVSVGTTF
ncbi:MAG: hypothetical protein OEZ68_08295 [Gammaproteobacteria bacterium]|nr:hypothetical protein [Gammaproteobacteria bacterium]MDH5800788.1 hypothetical protein [Gammaproteobacteria bacterium]